MQIETQIVQHTSKPQDLHSACDYYLSHAKILVQHGEDSLARVLLYKVFALNSYNEEAFSLYYSLLRRTHKDDEASQVAEIFFRTFKTAEATYTLAETKYLQGQDMDALKLYFQYVTFGEDKGDRLFNTYKNIGNIFVRLRDFDSAEEYYNKAYTIDTKSDVLLVNFGTLEIQRDRFDLAKERFVQALQYNLSSDRAWVGLALIHRSLGDFELARGNILRALDANFENTTALGLAAQWMFEDQFDSEIVLRLERYIEKNTEDVEISYLLARCYLMQKRYREALLELEKISYLEPKNQGTFQLIEEIKKLNLQKVSQESRP